MNVNEILEPWYIVDHNLVSQLNKEIPKGHVLYGLSFKTVARRIDNDDVLFEVLSDVDFRYAKVHLTWGTQANDSDYPLTQTYLDWQQVYQQIMVPDHADWST